MPGTDVRICCVVAAADVLDCFLQGSLADDELQYLFQARQQTQPRFLGAMSTIENELVDYAVHCS